MEPHTSLRTDLCLCQPVFRRGIKNCSLIQRTLVFHHVFVASGTVSTNNFSRTAFLSMRSFAPMRISKCTRAGDLAWSARNLRWKLEFQRLSTLKIQVTSFDLGQRLTRETVLFLGRSYLFISVFRPSSHMRTVHPSGCHTAVKPFFRANIMKIKLNLLQTEQGVSRLTSLASGASLAPSALTQSILVSLVAGQMNWFNWWHLSWKLCKPIEMWWWWKTI